MSSTTEQKIKLAAEFIVDSPPGEFHEVLNDVRVLVNDDVKLQIGVKQAVYNYNVEQFIVAKLNDRQVFVSKYGQLDDELTFFDPRSKQKFKFDHIKQSASQGEPQSPQWKDESMRAAIDDKVATYTAEHYPNGVSGTFCTPEGQIVIVVVSNMYNPSNFWNGRWRSVWTLSGASGKVELKGLLRAQVHYYEDGNVQLVSTKEVQQSVSIEGEKSSEQVLKLIKEAESEYQTGLNESYVQLADTTFKSLRRALPVTRNKVDWNKILNYKVGAYLVR